MKVDLVLGRLREEVGRGSNQSDTFDFNLSNTEAGLILAEIDALRGISNSFYREKSAEREAKLAAETETILKYNLYRWKQASGAKS